MAENRMFLLHRPSMLAAQLGKNLAGDWYTSPTAEATGSRIERLFSVVSIEYGSAPEDFVLAVEDSRVNPGATEDWDYDRERPRTDGLVQMRARK